MLTYNIIDWHKVIQPEISRQGYKDIPNCKNVEWGAYPKREIYLEFLTSEDEIMFILQFGKTGLINGNHSTLVQE